MQKLRRFFKEWIQAILISLALLIGFVFFIGNWFVVTSSSMENSLHMGDFVFVNKLAYGPRIPYTPLSLPFSRNFNRSLSFDYYRLPGYSEVQRNDIVAFNYPDLDTLTPIDHKSVWIKRVVGLPGESLTFKASKTYINGKAVPESNSLKFNYHVQLSGNEAAFFYKYDIREASRISTQNDWLIAVSGEEAENIREYKGIRFVRPQFKKEGQFEEEVYPYELGYGWNEDYYGPVIIPGKGKSIKLTIENIPLYRLCIEAYEGNELVEFGNKFYINGKLAKEYTFKLDYYFVAGDNRHNSSDSRFWGFLPESHLIGKVSTIFFSVDKSAGSFWKKLRWNRLFESAK